MSEQTKAVHGISDLTHQLQQAARVLKSVYRLKTVSGNEALCIPSTPKISLLIAMPGNKSPGAEAGFSVVFIGIFPVLVIHEVGT
jgi:hypothetical protein